jgi:hypothetical protein
MGVNSILPEVWPNQSINCVGWRKEHFRYSTPEPVLWKRLTAKIIAPIDGAAFQHSEIRCRVTDWQRDETSGNNEFLQSRHASILPPPKTGTPETVRVAC